MTLDEFLDELAKTRGEWITTEGLRHLRHKDSCYCPLAHVGNLHKGRDVFNSCTAETAGAFLGLEPDDRHVLMDAADDRGWREGKAIAVVRPRLLAAAGI